MNSTNAADNITTDFKDVCCYPDEILPKFFFFVLYLLVMLIGIPANIFSIFVSCQHIKQKNELGIYLFNLALSDLCFITGLPTWMSYINDHNDFWPYSSTMCIVSVFILFTNFYTSALLLTCIAVDRYLAIVHPLSFCFLRKPRTAAVVSAVTWAMVLIVNSVIISPPNIFNEDEKVCLEVFPLSLPHRRVNIGRFVLGFFLPTVVVVFCYCRICMEIRTNKATPISERRRMFKLMGSVLLSLTLCFGPLHIALLLMAALEKCKPPSWLFLLYQIGKALASLNCLADPLLYCFITRTGRSSLSQAIMLLKMKKGCNQ